MDDTAPPEQLIKLIIHQETIFSNWVKFAITVQGGLAAGLGVAWSEPKYGAFGFIVALIGVATAYLFARILYRHSQWSVWYVRRGQSLAAEIFPPKSELKPGLVAGWVVWFLSKIFGSPDEIGQLPPGPIARWVVSVLLFVAAVWFVIVILVGTAPRAYV